MRVSLGASNTEVRSFQSGDRKVGFQGCSTVGSEQVPTSLPSSPSSDEVQTRSSWRDGWRRTVNRAYAADDACERPHRPVSVANLCQAFMSSMYSTGERAQRHNNLVSPQQQESRLCRHRPVQKSGKLTPSPSRLGDDNYVFSSSVFYGRRALTVCLPFVSLSKNEMGDNLAYMQVPTVPRDCCLFFLSLALQTKRKSPSSLVRSRVYTLQPLKAPSIICIYALHAH